MQVQVSKNRKLFQTPIKLLAWIHGEVQTKSILGSCGLSCRYFLCTSYNLSVPYCELIDDPQAIAKRYISTHFIIDILAILPLLQVSIYVIYIQFDDQLRLISDWMCDGFLVREWRTWEREHESEPWVFLFFCFNFV